MGVRYKHLGKETHVRTEGPKGPSLLSVLTLAGDLVGTTGPRRGGEGRLGST